MKKPLLTLAALAAIASPAAAELLLHDSFDVAPGPLAGRGGWHAHSAQGVSPIVVAQDGASLVWEGLPPSKGSRILVGDDGEDLTHPIFPRLESGSVYVSFVGRAMAQAGDPPQYSLHLRGEAYNTRFFVKDNGDGTMRVGAGMTAGRPYFAGRALAPGEAFLAVLKYTFPAQGEQALLELFLNPDTSGDEPASADVVEQHRGVSFINEIALRQEPGSGTLELDDLRVATSWDGAMGRLAVSEASREALLAAATAREIPKAERMLRHNNPGLVVDAMVGLWAQPLPMDFDGDGDMDIVLATTNRPSGGTYLLENDGSGVLRAPVMIAPPKRNVVVTHTPDGPVIMEPGKLYRDFSEGLYAKPEPVTFEGEVYSGRANQWSLVDYDGDGALDLVIGTDDWRDYGWDDNFDAEGNWTSGPLRGRVQWARNEGTNDAPKFGAIQSVMAAGEPVDVYGFPSPNFVDWDGDGDLDLLCGEFLDRITLFENTGTRTAPEYAAGRFLEVDGEVLTMDLEMILVASVDWDGDGDPDLVVGEEDGRVALIENLGGGKASSPQYFRQRAEHVKPGALTTPTSVDWDGDGDDDIIAGNTAGYIEYVENLGGYPPKWAAPVRLEAGGQVIRVLAGENLSIQGPAEAKWGYTVVTSADWDMDGLPDLLVNTIIGRIDWYRNIGTRNDPRLAAAEPIMVEWPGETPQPAWNWWKPEPGTLVTQWRTKPTVIDANGDGLPDLVLQDHEGYLAMYPRERRGDQLVLLPGQRVFKHTRPDVTYDNNNLPMHYDEDGDGKNDLLMKEPDGSAVYFTAYPAYVSAERPLKSIHGEIRGEQAKRLVPPPDAEAGALRTNPGWAGRAGRRKILFTDWDGDGRVDLLVNSYSISFFRNVGEEGEWLFEEVGHIVPDRLAGHTTCPEVVDWNKDGITDLLIGAEDGFFYYYERASFDEMTEALEPK